MMGQSVCRDNEVEQPHEAWPIIEREPESEPTVPPDMSQLGDSGEPDLMARLQASLQPWADDQMARREERLAAMAEAGQKLALEWGHEPWSDSWARLVAETLDRAGRPEAADA